jgi:hypothetical protein
MRISNWGMFLLGIYLIVVGLSSFDIIHDTGKVTGLIGVVSGVLILMDHWRR